MSVPDTEYWKERALQLEAASHRNVSEVVNTIDAAYREATRDLDGKISHWYQRFADNNGIVDMAEARKLLNSDQLKEFKWTVNDYIKAGKENGISADWSKQLENASARWHISRYESLKLDMRETIETLYGKTYPEINQLLKSTYKDTYGLTAYEIQKGVGVGFAVTGLNDKAIQKAIFKPWGVDQRNFSDRIWKNKEALINELHLQLTRNLISGGNINDVVAAIEKKMGTSTYNAKRLVYTEAAYLRMSSNLDSFKEIQVGSVQIVAVLDERTSEICQTMDGTIVEIKDAVPGSTVPPFHPLCRSTIIPYYADLQGIGTRAARDPDSGKTVQIDRGISYKDWAKSFMMDDSGGSDGREKITSTGFTSEIGKKLEKSGIDTVPVSYLPEELSDDEIVERLAGGDMTKGSCSSVAFAFAGNKAGLDVLDFRGGESRLFFARNVNIREISKLPNVESWVVTAYNDIKGANEVMSNMQKDKLYYLATGRHASIVRKIDSGYEYLEMQSRYQNGFFKLDNERLKNRFRCQKSHTVAGYKYQEDNILIDVDSLSKNDEFKKMLTYINTKEADQQKGKAGNVK